MQLRTCTMPSHSWKHANGRTEEARRHLANWRIADSSTFPNAGLEQMVLISSSYVDFFECKFQSAVEHLNAAQTTWPL